MLRPLGAILLGLAALALSACWHRAFHTSIENSLSQTIYLTIDFEDEHIPQGHGYLPAGGQVEFPQSASEIAAISFRVGSRECHMDRNQIAQASRDTGRGLRVITLSPCSALR